MTQGKSKKKLFVDFIEEVREEILLRLNGKMFAK